MNDLVQQRNESIASVIDPLPGSIAYDNVRPINVSARYDGWTLYEVMCASHPHIDRMQWNTIFESGRIRKHDEPVAKETRVRGGEQYSHVFPDTIEPDVNALVRIIYEDDALVVINKPAPLPMHPSGRFNLNTMVSILNHVFSPLRLLPAHRLDANTTGIVVLCKNPAIAKRVQTQFDRGDITKQYLVRCQGHPRSDQFDCDESISKAPGTAGLRTIDPNGLPSLTEFTVTNKLADGESLLVAKLVTGRTNQIRIHLWGQGMPVVGDPLYLPERKLGATQTLSVDANAMCLHAWKLTLTHPLTDKQVAFVADPPDWVF